MSDSKVLVLIAGVFALALVPIGAVIVCLTQSRSDLAIAIAASYVCMNVTRSIGKRVAGRLRNAGRPRAKADVD